MSKANTDLGSLGSLTACVGVNLCIEYEDVYVLTCCKNVVNTAEADVVCPTVTTEDPYGLLGEELLVVKDILDVGAIASTELLKLTNESLCSSYVLVAVLKSCEVFLSSSLELSRSLVTSSNCADLLDKS